MPTLGTYSGSTGQRERAAGGLPTFCPTTAVSARTCKSHCIPLRVNHSRARSWTRSNLAVDAAPAPAAPFTCISANTQNQLTDRHACVACCVYRCPKGKATEVASDSLPSPLTETQQSGFSGVNLGPKQVVNVASSALPCSKTLESAGRNKEGVPERRDDRFHVMPPLASLRQSNSISNWRSPDSAATILDQPRQERCRLRSSLTPWRGQTRKCRQCKDHNIA